MGGAVAEVAYLGEDVIVRHCAGQFEVTVRHAALWVGATHKGLGYRKRERLTPEERLDRAIRGGDEVNAAHARRGGVAGAESVWGV